MLVTFLEFETFGRGQFEPPPVILIKSRKAKVNKGISYIIAQLVELIVNIFCLRPNDPTPKDPRPLAFLNRHLIKPLFSLIEH